MDLDEAADRLYGVPPEQFVGTRNELAAQAQGEGDRAAAAAIRKLAKPSQPAWQVNLLVRAHPTTLDDLAGIAATLRSAAESGDLREVRHANSERQTVVSRLSDEAGRLAADAGKPATASTRREVESTLQAALSSPEAAEQVASGRLVAALFDTGLDALGMLTLAPAPAPAAREPARPPQGGSRRAPAAAAGPADTDALAARDDAAQALAQAQEHAQRARLKVEQVEQEVVQLEARLGAVRQRAETARQEAVEADGLLQNAHREHDRARAACDDLHA
jgi:hypothetical protein